MAIIEVAALSKYYGKYMSIEQVSFAVEKGEIFGIVGGEDAGKTTVLDIVAGAVKPTSGKCIVCGLDVQSNVQQVARMLRVVSQNGETYSKLRVKNVEKYLKGIPDAARQRAQRWCAYFGIENSDVIRKMSKQKKTALYMIDVLLGMPRILMLDDPFDGADADFIGRMSRFLQNENKRGLTVVLTAREDRQIAHLCTRIVHMADGRLRDDAPAQEQADLFEDDFAQAPRQNAEPMQEQATEQPHQNFGGYVPQENYPQESYAQEPYQQTPYGQHTFEQEHFAQREPYAQQERFAPQMSRPYGEAQAPHFAEPAQDMSEDAEFAQMRRDFYAQNTAYQPQMTQNRSAAYSRANANSDDMFRQLEQDFFEPQTQEEPARQQWEDFDQTRRVAMPQDAYRMDTYQSAPHYVQQDMQQTRAIPRFGAQYSRPYAQSEGYSARGQERFAGYEQQQAPRQSAYRDYPRTGAYASPVKESAFENVRQDNETSYEADFEARRGRHVAPDFEMPRMSREPYASPAKENFESPRYSTRHSASQEDVFANRESRSSNFGEPVERTGRYTASYEQNASVGAHARHAAPEAEPAYEGKHARSAYSEESAEQPYSRYTQQETSRPQAAYSASHAKETTAYPLYSSRHNASVHTPSTQGNRRIVLIADNVPMDFLRNIGATALHRDGDRVEFFFNGQMDKLIVALSQMNVRDLRVSLDMPVSYEQE